MFFKRIAGPFREFGAVAGFLYSIDRVLSAVSPRMRLHVYELMVQPITDKPLLPRQFKQSLEMRQILPGDAELGAMPVRPEVMAARIEQNATCLGAFKNGKMIGYMWFCDRSYDEDEVRCTYLLGHPDESVFDFDFYLYPEYRMGLGFVGIWNGANEFLTRRGVRYTFSRLTRFNLASRRAHRHLGWKLVGRAIFLQLWQLEVMFATIRPYVDVSLAKESRVRLVLRPDVLTE
ncbi:MAG: N-acetyltransferase [Betaproteobacteria bacterium]|nr:N-acetyltransferase [Betaproteobacteria bacterium]